MDERTIEWIEGLSEDFIMNQAWEIAKHRIIYRYRAFAGTDGISKQLHLKPVVMPFGSGKCMPKSQ